MTRFAAVLVRAGRVRRVTYEALNESEAHDIALSLGIGYEGVAADSVPLVRTTEPEAYSLADARRLLGNVSRATIYRWLDDGSLERVRGIRRLLITRKSILRRASEVAAYN